MSPKKSGKKASPKSTKGPKNMYVWSNKKKTQPAKPQQRRRTIPAGFSYRTTSYAQVRQGADGPYLVFREIFPINLKETGLSALIPFSPTKWKGTRACNLAANYTGYRPLSVSVQWQPSVGTSESGNIAFGTCFDGSRLAVNTWENLSQMLPATNGGFMVTMWQPTSSRITCGTNLRDNLFPTYQINEDEIPFWMMVAGSKKLDAAGYLIVNASISLKNPTNGQADPPTSFTGAALFTHDDETKTTKMSIAQAAVNKLLTVGQDYTFVFNDLLKGTAGQTIAHVLSPIVATVSSIADGKINFNVDSNIASQTIPGVLVGLLRNF